MSKTIIEQLDAPIPRSAVSQRQGGGGRSLSYLAGHYVIDRLNKVFGPMNWASKIESLQLVHTAENSVHYIAQVRLVVEDENGKKTEHTDVGYGDGSDKTNIGKAHELAVKEATTDALKRAAKNLGQSMGLALYSKDQENVVEDEEPKVAPKQQAAPKAAKAAEKSPVGNDKAIVMGEINSYAKIVAANGKPVAMCHAIQGGTIHFHIALFKS